MTTTRRLRFRLPALLALLLPGAGANADLPRGLVLEEREVQAVLERAEDLGERARVSVQPLAEGQTKVLEAVVMSVKGRPRWRADAKAPWKVARVDDVLRPGAMIRTGVRASVALRVGHNATVLVDRMTAVALPEVIQIGATLRTAVQITRGQVDFKVDRVGLNNDFTVVTPSSTLAVRGTDKQVAYGGLRGTEVRGARTNMMRAIEVRYFLSRFSYYLSGAATSGDEHMEPVMASLFQTFGPPRILTGLIEDEVTPDRLDDSFPRLDVRDGYRIARGLGGSDSTVPIPDPDCIPGLDAECGDVAQFICDNLFVIFLRYDAAMVSSFEGESTGGGFRFPGVDEVFREVGAICNDADEWNDDVLRDITEEIEAYCSSHFGRQADVDLCIRNFVESVVAQHEGARE